MATGITLFAYIAIATGALAIMNGAVAFLFETVKRVICLATKIMGKEEPEPSLEEEKPLFAKAVLKGVDAVRRRFDVARPIRKFISSRNVGAYSHGARSNARAHRSAQRPTFTRGSKNSSDDGESDQEDPPEPSYFHPVTPYHYSNPKLNSLSFPWRITRSLGCWRVPCHKSTARGYAA
jgi:hypothetical protein